MVLQAISLGQDSDGSEKEEEKETKPRAKKRKTITSYSINPYLLLTLGILFVFKSD